MAADQSPKEMKSGNYPVVLPIMVFLWSCILPALVLAMPVLLPNGSKDYLANHLYLIGTIGQLLIDLPAVFLFFRMMKIEKSPIRSSHRISSSLVGFLLAALLAAPRFFATGKLMGGGFMGGVPAFTQSLRLPPPWNILASISAVLAYGPGEAIFVVYLILALDKALGNPQRIFSRGVLVTSILWALPHVFNVFYFGLSAIPNVLIMFFLGLVMGVLLKGTRSAWGPIIFWTLVNGTSM